MNAEHRPQAPRAGHAPVVRVPGFTLLHGFHIRGSELPKHTHDDPSFCYVLRGYFTEHSAGHVADCRPEGLKLTPAGELHWNRFLADETRGLRIDVDRSRFVEHPRIYRLLDERLQTSGRGITDVVQRLLAQLEIADAAAGLAVEGLLLELMAALAREAAPAVGPPRPRWLREADALIHELYTSPVSLRDLAQAVGVTPATLARGYRRAFHTTVGEQVRRLRIEHARRELAQTAEPLAAIAIRAGFFDQSHFTNVFRRYTGVTPGRYRAGLARPGVPSPPAGRPSGGSGGEGAA